jgi:ribosomal protein S18 acetylase RimI-like enzyme
MNSGYALPSHPHTDPVVVREATDDQAPLLLAILRAAFAEYRGRLDPPSGVEGETVESIRQKLRAGCAVLAFLGDEPAGCVFYRPEVDHVYLGRLAVIPGRRRLGVGRTLIQYVEGQAQQRLLGRVRLGVRVKLPGLLEYYERLGYSVVGSGAHAGYDEPTYVVMEKTM